MRLLRPPTVAEYERMTQQLRRIAAELATDRADALAAEKRRRYADARAIKVRLSSGHNDVAQFLLDTLAPEPPGLTAARRADLDAEVLAYSNARRAS